MTISDFLLMGVGGDGIGVPISVTTTADPQLQFFENFSMHLGAAVGGFDSNGTLSVHAVNIPLSLSFNNVIFYLNRSASLSAGSIRNIFQMGLYSMNAGTLSLANSAGVTLSIASSDATTSFNSWISLATSATQNISPGAWYFAFNQQTQSTNFGLSGLINTSFNPANAIPGGFFMGRMTVSTAAMPVSIETSKLDVTGSDAVRKPYIIITA